jgi:hypothetical protein
MSSAKLYIHIICVRIEERGEKGLIVVKAPNYFRMKKINFQYIRTMLIKMANNGSRGLMVRLASNKK